MKTRHIVAIAAAAALVGIAGGYALAAYAPPVLLGNLVTPPAKTPTVGQAADLVKKG